MDTIAIGVMTASALGLSPGARSKIKRRSVGRPPGWRPVTILGSSAKELRAARILPKGRSGRPRRYDSAKILALVEMRQRTAEGEGQPLTRRAALVELMLHAQRTRDPKKYENLVKWKNHYEHELFLSPSRSLSRAFRRPSFAAEQRHLRKLERLISYHVNGRPASK